LHKVKYLQTSYKITKWEDPELRNMSYKIIKWKDLKLRDICYLNNQIIYGTTKSNY